MKLTYLVSNLEVNKYFVQCEMESYSQDEALAYALKKIKDDKGIFDKLGVFGPGLKSRFEQEKLISNGKLTSDGEKVARTGYVWKGESGRYILTVLGEDEHRYLLKADKFNNEDLRGYDDEDTDGLSLKGEYVMPRLKRGYRKISMAPKIKVRPFDTVNVICTYYYETKKMEFNCTLQGEKIAFDEDGGFYGITTEEALQGLSEALADYEMTVEGTKVIVDKIPKDNALFESAIESVLSEGIFHVDGGYYSRGIELKFRLYDIKPTVRNEKVARELLVRYLVKKAEKSYMGMGETATSITEFYSLFEECVTVPDNLMNIYADVKKKAFETSKTAYLRLCAYNDLLADFAKRYEREGTLYDFSNENRSMAEIVEKIVGNGDVKSVTVITKFAYKNTGISRALAMFANALRRRYAVPLTVITAEIKDYTQYEETKKYYEKLGKNENIIFRKLEQSDIVNIHDRYYRIERLDGSVDWVKMTGELDALRFEGDFADGKTPAKADENTQGRIKEMTIVFIDESGVPPAVNEAIRKAGGIK